jgi:alkylation response protein AidB-like acyl-CoA dehydrogenase
VSSTTSAPDQAWSSEHRDEIRNLARQVAADVYAPLAAELESSGAAFPASERRRLGDLGFLGIALPEQYGGAGAPLLDALVVIEELAKVCRPAAFQVFEANTGPARAIELFGSDELKQRLLPAVVSGAATIAIAISEPDAGSAATDMKTSARRDGDDFVVNGGKRWISNGGEADHYLLYARMSDAPGARGIGALVVDGDTLGLTYGAPERLMGFRGIPSCDLNFDNARVPAANLVVGPGGFKQLFGAFCIERLGNATMSLAIGQAALDQTVRYVQERRQFGRDIVEFQAVQLQLADMVMGVEAARQLIDAAARQAGTGIPDALQVSIAKCVANEMGKRVSDLAMQLHGGNGYTEEYGMARLHRDAHGWAIAGGTPNIQRVRIVSELLGRSFGMRP